MAKEHCQIGCCGIACGLCPRHYTEGSSRCGGCGSKEHSNPYCAILRCCNKHDKEICSLCGSYPCDKYGDMEKLLRDSFVSHKKIYINHETVLTNGFEALQKDVEERMYILHSMLDGYNDGKNKSFFCLAASLLPISALRDAVNEASQAQGDIKAKAAALRAALEARAKEENILLKLNR